MGPDDYDFTWNMSLSEAENMKLLDEGVCSVLSQDGYDDVFPEEPIIVGS